MDHVAKYCARVVGYNQTSEGKINEFSPGLYLC